MVLDAMHVNSFHYETIAGAKTSLFLELIIVLLCLLMIKRKIPQFFVKGLTQG